MAIIDDIVSILRGANPDADPQTVQAQAEQMAASPNAASVMARITGAATGLASPVLSGLGDAAVGAGDVVNKALPAVVPPLASAPSPAAPTTPTPPQAPTMAPPAPVAAPSAPSPAATPSTLPSKAPSSPATASSTPPPVSSPTPDDNARRQALLDAANKQARMASIPAAIAGIGGAIGNAAQVFGVKAPEGAEKDILDRAQQNLATNKAGIEQQISNDPNSAASQSARQLVLQIAPQMANQPGFAQMTDQELRDKLPLVDTMMKAKAAEDSKALALKQLQANKELMLGEKNSQFEDRAINQAMGRIAGVRGDQSLARVENQRDAASSAYTLLQQAKNENRPLTQPEYYDLLGQMWKARTGTSPTTEAMRDLDAKTFQGNLGKVETYFTGKPAAATTQAALNNLQQFVAHTGKLADTQHDAYMAPHTMKPAGVSDEAWAPVTKVARGQSFADAVKAANGSAPQSSSGTSSDPLGIR